LCPPGSAAISHPRRYRIVKERWLQLCEQATNEQDHEKLIALVKEITQLLEDKERRTRGETPQAPA